MGWVCFQSVGWFPFQWGGSFPFRSVGLGPLAINRREDLLQVPGPLEHPSAFLAMELGPLSINGARSPFIYMGLDPPSIVRGCVPFQLEGLGPLLLYGVGSPLNQWGYVPFYYVGLGPLAIDWREDLLQIPSSVDRLLRRTACVVLSHRRSKSQGLGPLLLCGAKFAFHSARLCPFSIRGAGSPFKQSGWVPFYSMGLGPLSITGAGSPFTLWGWAPPLFSGAESPFILWDSALCAPMFWRRHMPSNMPYCVKLGGDALPRA